jgi:hypothetical protein
MRNTIRLTEADLTKLIRKVISEQPTPYPSRTGVSSTRKVNPFPSVGKGFDNGPRPTSTIAKTIAVCMGMKDLPQACKSLIGKVTGSDNKLSLNNIMGSMKDFAMCDKSLASEDNINKFSACLMKQLKK